MPQSWFGLDGNCDMPIYKKLIGLSCSCSECGKFIISFKDPEHYTCIENSLAEDNGERLDLMYQIFRWYIYKN